MSKKTDKLKTDIHALVKAVDESGRGTKLHKDSSAAIVEKMKELKNLDREAHAALAAELMEIRTGIK